MRRKPLQFGALFLIVVIGACLRIYSLRDVPAGLFCDEAAMGYNAHAVATAGINEHGDRFPLFFWSFGGYKNPIYIYTAAAIIRFAGLDEFTTRLPAALFGLGTIVAIFFLGRAMFNPWIGLFSAAFLAFCPWHIHFSRIAFELISFPFLFVIGVTFLVRYTQGKSTLPLAMLFFGLCPYSYAISVVFVPLFLLGFSILYSPMLIRRWKQTILAFAVIAAVAAPAGVFYYKHPTGTSYLKNTASIGRSDDYRKEIQGFVANYRWFFSRSFLFDRGDPIVRHAVPGRGELLPVMAPFLAIGLILMLLRLERFSKLLLWWVVLYPVGASLMNEIPSATRGIIGAPIFCLLAGIGLGAALKAVGWITYWRPLSLVAQTLSLGFFLQFAIPQFAEYAMDYFVSYPKKSAPTNGGFQYGFRQAIGFMEPERGKYPLMLISTTDGNQNHIFPLFYRSVDPREWLKTSDPGYLILDPTEYKRYSVDKPVLYALQTSDLKTFDDYVIRHRVLAPGGYVAFEIAEIRSRKNFITNWSILGPFPNDSGSGVETNFIDVLHPSDGEYGGVGGKIRWKKFTPQFVRVDLNQFFSNADPKHPGNPEYVCAYAAVKLFAIEPNRAFVEIDGADDTFRLWINGVPLGDSFFLREMRKFQMDLPGGYSTLMVKGCEATGAWFFTLRITDESGANATNVAATPLFDDEKPTVKR